MTINRTVAITVAMILAAVGIALGFKSCSHSSTSITPAVQKTQDSIKATHKADSVSRDSLVKKSDSASASGVKKVQSAETHSHRADSLSAIAARLALEATQSKDSAAKWREAYRTETQATANLRKSNDSLRGAWLDEHNSKLYEIEARVKAEIRLAKVEHTNLDLEKAAKNANKCKFGPFPCLTRTQANVLGVVEGVVITTAAVVVAKKISSP